MKYEDLRNDMVKAMKERNKEKKDAISSLVEAIKKVAIDTGCRDKIDDTLFDKVVLKELKSCEEQIASCPQSREDLLNEYKARLNYIKEYAPKLLSVDEIKKILSEKFSDIIATKNKGNIMKEIMPEFKGKADGKLINNIIEELCK